LVSNELEEIMGLSDHIHVMSDGQLSKPLKSAEVTVKKIRRFNAYPKREPSVSKVKKLKISII
jgi:ABC-type sugar transport system ATPase subunit